MDDTGVAVLGATWFYVLLAFMVVFVWSMTPPKYRAFSDQGFIGIALFSLAPFAAIIGYTIYGGWGVVWGVLLGIVAFGAWAIPKIIADAKRYPWSR